MIPVRMYQDERQLAWGNINIFAKSTIHSREVVSIHRPLGYGPSTLPLRHSADEA